jgi:hypothetical protein
MGLLFYQPYMERVYIGIISFTATGVLTLRSFSVKSRLTLFLPLSASWDFIEVAVG